MLGVAKLLNVIINCIKKEIISEIDNKFSKFDQ